MDPNQQPQTTPERPEEFNPASVPFQPVVEPESVQSEYAPIQNETADMAQPVTQTSAPVLMEEPAAVFVPVPVVTPSPEVVPVLVPQSPVVSPTPTQVKKSRLWIWIILGVASAVLVGLLVTFFVAKNSGDVAAKAYTTESQSYLDDVYDAAVGSADDPASIKKDVEAIKAPILKPTFLSVASGDYATTEKLSTVVNSKVKLLTDKINGNAQYYTFYTDYLALYSDLNDIYVEGSVAIFSKSTSGATTFMTDFRDKLQELKKLIDDSIVPSDVAGDVKEFGQVYGELASSWSRVVVAYQSGSRADYDTASDEYTTAGDGLDAAKKPVVEYYNDLSSKTKDAAKDLQAYRNTIK